MNTNLHEGEAPGAEKHELESSSEQPPMIIRIAAAICVVAGTWSLVNTITNFLSGRFFLDLGFLAIPIGRGLLKGRSSSRMWAMILSGLFFVVLVAGLVALISDALGWTELWKKNIGGPITTPERIAVAIGFQFMLFSTAIVVFGLWTLRAREWCVRESGNERQFGTNWTLPLFLAALTPLAAVEVAEYLSDRSQKVFMRSLYHVDTEFEFRDSVSGNPVKRLSFSGVGANSSDSFSPQIVSRFIDSAEGGSGIRLSGISDRPLAVTFSTDGRKPISYTISKTSPSRVFLTFNERK